jgi:hypothetical protein
VPRSRYAPLTARLERLKNLVDDLARAHEGGTPLSRAMADIIKGEIDVVLRALKRAKPAAT